LKAVPAGAAFCTRVVLPGWIRGQSIASPGGRRTARRIDEVRKKTSVDAAWLGRTYDATRWLRLFARNVAPIVNVRHTAICGAVLGDCVEGMCDAEPLRCSHGRHGVFGVQPSPTPADFPA
jgi:hypothetical protein